MPAPPDPSCSRVLLEQHRIALLDHLQRRGLGDADGRAAVGDAVAVHAAAIAAAADQVHHVAAAGIRVDAAQGEVAAGPGGGGEQLIRQRRRQGGEHRLGNALAHLRRATGDRPWILGVEERALGIGDMQRQEGAGVDRHLREDVLDGQVDRRAGGGDDAVHGPQAGRARPGHVEIQVGAAAAQAQVDLQGLVHHPVGVHVGDAMVVAVWNAGDLGPHLLLGAALQLDDAPVHGVGAIAVEEGGEPALAHGQRRRLRLDVADPLLSDADVGEDDGEDLLVHSPLLEQLDRRQAQALLLHLGGVRREAARHRAADVRPMTGVGQPGEEFPLVEERLHEAHVHQMRAAEIGIVDDVGVAGL